MLDKEKKIIDERQQLQSVTNSKNCFIVLIILLGISIIVQTLVFALEPMHYMPELIIMLFVCVLNLVLDIRQGNLYTKEMQSKKRNLILYVSTALGVSLLIGIGNYIKYDLAPHILIFSVPMIFGFTLGGMLALDWLQRNFARKKLEKMEKELLQDEEE